MIGYTEPAVGFGFFLNSNISYAATIDPERMACELLLRQGSQSFIDKQDSYLDCGQLFRFTREDLTRRRGRVTGTNALLILAGMGRCTLLTPIQKANIKTVAKIAGYMDE